MHVTAQLVSTTLSVVVFVAGVVIGMLGIFHKEKR